MVQREYVDGIHSAQWVASDRADHEPYLVVVRDDATAACSCLDYFRHANLYGEPNHACKHIQRRAKRIIDDQQAKAKATAEHAATNDDGRPLRSPARSSISIA